MFPLFIKPAGFGGSASIGFSNYYTVLQALMPVGLLKLEDTTTNALDINGAIAGTYGGTYLQAQSSLIGSSAARSVQFNSGNILLSGSLTAPQIFTISCRFKATASASGTLFSFDSRVSDEFDRVLYFDPSTGRLVFYGYTNQVILVTTPLAYRDNQAHSLAVRAEGATIAIFVDGVLVVQSSVSSLVTYLGFWNIGGFDRYGRQPLATGIRMAGFARFDRALTDAEIASIHQEAGFVPPPALSVLSPYTASQSRVDYGGSGTFASLTDGDYTTGGVAGYGATSWLQATFPATVTVASVTVAGGIIPSWGTVSYYLNGAAIQYSTDNVNWTTIATITGVTDSGPTIEKTFSFSPIVAQYWRISGGGYLVTTELRFA